jgi:serine/threonine protein phosphatase PrpC
MGNLLRTPNTEKETHIGKTNDGLEYGVSSMQGWRFHMEDAHITEEIMYADYVVTDEVTNELKYSRIELPGHSLFAVFDGHGGEFAAAYAGKNLIRVLSRQAKFIEYSKFVLKRSEILETLSSDEEKASHIESGLSLLKDALVKSFIEIDKEIAYAVKGIIINDAEMPMGKPVQHNPMNGNRNTDGVNDNNVVEQVHTQSPISPDETDSGTTACVVVITPEWIVCANAGDSRAIMSRLGNNAVALSEDHKPDGEPEERRIRNAGGYVAAGRVEGDLAVSRGLGDFRFKNMAVVLSAPLSGIRVGNTDSVDNAEAANNPNNKVTLPEDQKVSPVPDVRMERRNKSQDKFVIVACDGIWDVQCNEEASNTVSSIFNEGENNIGLICEEVRTKMSYSFRSLILFSHSSSCCRISFVISDYASEVKTI